MRSLPLSLVLALIFSGVRAGAAVAQAPPDPLKPAAIQIAFEDAAVTASGLTPGRQMIWFGVEHRVDPDYSGTMAQHYAAAAVAADGTARLELDHAPAPRSFWVAVDLDSGALLVAAPQGYRIAKPHLLSRLGLGQGDKADELLDDRQFLMGLMVRPGVGAWAFTGGDGGPRDEDGVNNGHLSFALDKFDPLPGSPAAPAKLAATDLWIVVDPLAMEIAVHKGGVAQ
jgi:hypothetical protein